MRSLTVLALLVLCASSCGSPPSQVPQETAQQAETSWLAAVPGNTAAAGTLLDEQFEWTDSRGRTRARNEALASLPALAANLQGQSNTRWYGYDQLEVLTGERPGARFMRVWARRPQGWRLFAMIETASAPTAPQPFSPTMSGPALDCGNPCRDIPFNPESPAQQEMVSIFEQLKVDEWHPNPERWAPYVLDDVYYVTSAVSMSKADRVARLTQQRASKAAAVPGDPVLNMRIVEFGPAAVMMARHAPYRGGKPYYSVRVWAHRDGRWQLANTQQTVIEAADPVAAVAPRP
jgi:hypothetical protein